MKNFNNNFNKVNNAINNCRRLIAIIESSNNPDKTIINNYKDSGIRTAENFLNFYKYPVSKENVTAVFENKIDNLKKDF